MSSGSTGELTIRSLEWKSKKKKKRFAAIKKLQHVASGRERPTRLYFHHESNGFNFRYHRSQNVSYKFFSVLHVVWLLSNGISHHLKVAREDFQPLSLRLSYASSLKQLALSWKFSERQSTEKVRTEHWGNAPSSPCIPAHRLLLLLLLLVTVYFKTPFFLAKTRVKISHFCLWS